MDVAPDFHVVSLRYTLQPSDTVTYESPPPVEFETPEARFRLVDAALTAEMKIHVSTETEARALVDPVLRAWEAAADLRQTCGGFRFTFGSAEIIDRSPPSPVEPGVIAVALRGEVAHVSNGNLTVHMDFTNYPEPPGPFRPHPRRRKPLASLTEAT